MSAVNAVVAPAPSRAGERQPRARIPRYVLALGALVAVLAIVPFLPILNNGFVDWDDEKNFVLNAHFQGWGWAHFRWAWTTLLLGVYQPLAWLLLEAQYLVWGLEPRGYHATSLLLHSANAVLLYFLTLALLRRGDPRASETFPRASAAAAAVAATLFAVHPLRTEAVAWASCQPYLPCAMFCLLSLLAYLRAVPARPANGRPHRGWLVASTVLFGAALLNKAMALGLPVVLIALDAYPLRRLGGALSSWFGADKLAVWIEKLPYFTLSLAFAVVAVAAKEDTSFTHGVAGPKASLSLAQLCRSLQAIALYIEKTLLPRGINAYYPASGYVDLKSSAVVLSIVSVLGVSVLLWRTRRRWPALLVAWVSYLVMLAPTLGVVNYSGQIAADRYSYLPMMGFYIVLAWGLLRLAGQFATGPLAWRRGVGAVAVALTMALVAALCAHSWTISRTWHDSETLWAWADLHGGNSVAEVQNFLGQARLKAGQTDDAMRRFSEAVRLKPDYADAYCNQAVVWANAGEYASAETGFRKALSISATHPHARLNLALLLKRQGRMNEAVGEYAEALRNDPDNERLLRQLSEANAQPGVHPVVADAAWRVLLHPADLAAHVALAKAVERGQAAAR